MDPPEYVLTEVQVPENAESYLQIDRLNSSNLGLKSSHVENDLVDALHNFLCDTHLDVTLAVFFSLAAVNLSTLFFGGDTLLSKSTSILWRATLSNFVFDSWGTLAGIFGSVVLFVPVLLGTPARHRKYLSVFFSGGSISIGVSSSVLWDHFFGSDRVISYGSSAIDFSAQSIIFTIAVFALIRSYIGPREAKVDWYVRNSFRVIYATLIITTLWFVLLLQPIFVATAQFNWRGHEISFLSGITITAIYLAITSYGAKKQKTSRKEIELSTRIDGMSQGPKSVGFQFFQVSFTTQTGSSGLKDS